VQVTPLFRQAAASASWIEEIKPVAPMLTAASPALPKLFSSDRREGRRASCFAMRSNREPSTGEPFAEQRIHIRSLGPFEDRVKWQKRATDSPLLRVAVWSVGRLLGS
jgi:hypothetical protein